MFLKEVMCGNDAMSLSTTLRVLKSNCQCPEILKN